MNPVTLLAPVVALLLATGVSAAAAADPHAHHPKPKAAASEETAAAKVPGAAGSTYRVAIGKSQEGVKTPLLKAKQGEQVRIVLASERPGTVEIHGYNRSIAVKPGAEATLLVQANQTGRFPVHLHTPEGAHIEVASFDVQPK